MKKIVFLLFLSVLAVESYGQTKSIEEIKREEMRFEQSTTKLTVQLMGDEGFDSGSVQFRIVTGDNKQFHIKDKSDFDVIESMKGDVHSFNTIPDALDYLSDRGYNVEFYSSVILNDVIRHNFILSKISL